MTWFPSWDSLCDTSMLETKARRPSSSCLSLTKNVNHECQLMYDLKKWKYKKVRQCSLVLDSKLFKLKVQDPENSLSGDWSFHTMCTLANMLSWRSACPGTWHSRNSTTPISNAVFPILDDTLKIWSPRKSGNGIFHNFGVVAKCGLAWEFTSLGT